MPLENSTCNKRGALRRHVGWWVALSLLVVAWWLPLLDIPLYHYGVWTSDEAAAVVVSYMMFITMPLSTVAVLLSLYKALRWAMKLWKARERTADAHYGQ